MSAFDIDSTYSEEEMRAFTASAKCPACHNSSLICTRSWWGPMKVILQFECQNCAEVFRAYHTIDRLVEVDWDGRAEEPECEGIRTGREGV